MERNDRLSCERMKKLSIRSMLVAPKGKKLVSVDLSQAESWIVAYLSQDRNMQYSLNNSDIHTDTAASVVVDPENYCIHSWEKLADDVRRCTKCTLLVVKTARYIGKRYNHASSYRMKPPRAAQVINKDSDKPPYVTVTMGESTIFSERWHKRYPNVSMLWWPEIEAQLNRDRTITTTYGRKRVFYSNWGDNLFKEATAHEPQSTVWDHFGGMLHPELGIPGGMREIRKRIILKSKDILMVNESHDSCILEVPAESARDIGLEMQSIVKRPLIIKGVEFTIPVDGEIGERWGELEKLI
jgi:DNA polymerase I-like protein with 3'-5' exonuclease and polymerase domains